MKAIILAGGEGKRLRPLTETRPKPLMRVADRSLIDISVERLALSGVKEAAVTLGYRGEDIKKELGEEKHGVKITYFEEKEPLGTAGGVKNASSFIEGDTVILSGDALTDIDYRALLSFHERTGSAVTIAAAEKKRASLFGVIECDGDMRVTGFLEKPPLPDEVSALINCGIYVIKKEVIDALPEGKFLDFAKDVFPELLKKGEKLSVFKDDFFWCDIGSFADYRRSNLLTLSPDFFIKCKGDSAERRGLVSDSVVGRNSRVLTDAVVINSVVGRNTRIGKASRLDSCILGDGVTVGENALIGKGAVIGDFAIVGNGAVIPSGVSVAAFSVNM